MPAGDLQWTHVAPPYIKIQDSLKGKNVYKPRSETSDTYGTTAGLLQGLSCSPCLRFGQSVEFSKPVGTVARGQKNPSPQARLALDWIEAFTYWNLEAIYALTTARDDFAYAYLPASIGIAQKTMEEWRLYNLQMKAMLPDFSVRPASHSLIGRPRVGQRTSSPGRGPEFV